MLVDRADTATLRKARGAFFTPTLIARHVARWALRGQSDTLFEPSCGDAAFLVEAVNSLRELGVVEPVVAGVEIHPESARAGADLVRRAGGVPDIVVGDFFDLPTNKKYRAVIGNPPYVRYQDWSGESRTKSRAAALASGVSLTSLASSWAAFAVHSTAFLERGGRLGLVLPAELLSTNYASPIRQFLFDKFKSVDLVLFTERVFPEAEADVVLLLADGFDDGPTDHAAVFQAQNADDLGSLTDGLRWSPLDPSAKWTGSLVRLGAQKLIAGAQVRGTFGPLQSWGETTLGMVTGNNSYFALSEDRALSVGLGPNDVLKLSPPGSSHLRGLDLSNVVMKRLAREGRSTRLFRPSGDPSPAAKRYIAAGKIAGVDRAYKTRIRKEWWRVPILEPADLLLTYMNADTPRIVGNSAGAHHLNSVHGVYLKSSVRGLGRELLPIASLNSITALSAETAGRSYGGGILKMEPKEADGWLMPSVELVRRQAVALRALKVPVAALLRYGRLVDAIALVDAVLFDDDVDIDEVALSELRLARAELVARRQARSESGKT